MKTKIFALAGLLFVSIWTNSGFAWSAPGHQAIGEAAIQMLGATPEGKAIVEKINEILGGETIDDAATWLDRVREHGPFESPSDKDEATQFGRDFPKNNLWHFTNFLVGSQQYEFSSNFATSDDVVHQLESAVTVLEKGSSKMSQLEALRVVIHLCGDIHQPLHCVTGYFDLSDMNHPKLLSSLDGEPEGTPEDRGGNQLYYTSSQEFHALWDLGLPRLISNDVSGLAGNVEVPNLGKEPATKGDYHHWPELWASDSIQQGAEAYKGIVFKQAAYVSDHRDPSKTMLKIMIGLPGGINGYREAQEVLAQSQLTKAAVHLAQLLERIRFQ